MIPPARSTLVALAVSASLSACADASLTRSGLLSSYDGMTRSDGVLTRASFRIDRERALAAKTVAIVPASVSGNAGAALAPEQLRLVANGVDRSVCAGLSERFRIVSPSQAPDLVVQTHITGIVATDKTIAGLSSAAGIGGTVASAATGLPIRVPRIPIGLGSLSVEAEAKAADRTQVAALTWARGADAVMTRPRASDEADAYTLAGEFGADFARLVVTGDDPIKPSLAALPSLRGVGEFLGADAKEAACARFGRDPGIKGLVGGMVGLPPGWTDPGAAKP
ncbi:DUF3313 domain-containing protein [Bosea thiooxidans]